MQMGNDTPNVSQPFMPRWLLAQTKNGDEHN
jgi:hypothetical protein